MSLMTPDVSAATLGSTEMNTPGSGFQAPSAGAEAQFGEVLASLQPGAELGSVTSGQAFAGLPLPAVNVEWAPALKVQALGEHLQLITPGAEPGSDISLEAFARSQGLDEVTIGWLMGQGTEASGPVSAGTVGALAWTPSPAMAGALWTLATADQMTPATLVQGQLAASAAAGMVYGHPPAWAEGVLTPAPALPGAPATGVDGLIGVLQDPSADAIGPEASSAKPAATVPGLIGVGASLAALWGPGTAQGIGSPRSAAQAEQPTVEPTESLMATLRSPAATALATLQRQLQNPALANSADSKPSANLRVSDLDLSQSLVTEGLELQNLLDDWSTRLDGPSAGETQQNSALAAARGTGVMANSPLGIAPQGSAPQLGIDLADKFEQLAEKMGQAVAQRMLSEIEKGHWHLKLMLRPATLGHIEVEMRMRSGELDASFVASQNLTRELLQESLPRLRETLTQLGMDVANMNVDSGRSQQGDGGPTPRANAAQTRNETSTGSAEKSTITAPHQERRGQEGWDVMV